MSEWIRAREREREQASATLESERVAASGKGSLLPLDRASGEAKPNATAQLHSESSKGNRGSGRKRAGKAGKGGEIKSPRACHLINQISSPLILPPNYDVDTSIDSYNFTEYSPLVPSCTRALLDIRNDIPSKMEKDLHGRSSNDNKQGKPEIESAVSS